MEKLKFLEIVPVKKDNCKEIIVLTHTKKQNYKPMSDVGSKLFTLYYFEIKLVQF